jgi:hypothetical protein
MKTKLNFNHRLLMGLLVMGSVFSMLVSSAFITSPAWAATLAQSGSTGATSLSSINPASLGTENSLIQTVGSVESRDKHVKKGDDNENTNSITWVSGTVSGLVVTPTRASFALGGVGVRMDANLINGFTFSDGDNVTVQGNYLGNNGTGTFLATEVESVP